MTRNSGRNCRKRINRNWGGCGRAEWFQKTGAYEESRFGEQYYLDGPGWPLRGGRFAAGSDHFRRKLLDLFHPAHCRRLLAHLLHPPALSRSLGNLKQATTGYHGKGADQNLSRFLKGHGFWKYFLTDLPFVVTFTAPDNERSFANLFKEEFPALKNNRNPRTSEGFQD
jgi:hypothetical protein